MEEAIRLNDAEKTEVLLIEGADPNQTFNGDPLLFSTEDPKIIDILLEYGANPTIPDKHGYTKEEYTFDETIKNILKKERKKKFTHYRGTLKKRFTADKGEVRFCSEIF